MDLNGQHLSVVDYITLLSLLFVSMAIGVYYACKQRKKNTIQKYLLADRKMNYLFIAMSAYSTVIAPSSFVGVPAEVYVYGTQIWMTAVPQLLSFPFYAHVLMPIYMNLNSSSLYTYHQRRYNKILWKFCAMTGILEMTMKLSVVVFASSNVFSQVTGINIWMAAILVLSVCVTYTAIGGMKVVIWTDFIQGIIILIALSVIIVLGTINAGGLVTVLAKSIQGGRLELFNFSFDMTARHTFWSVVFGCYLSLMVYRIGNQACAQRFFTAPDLNTAQKASYLGIGIQLIAYTCICYIGLVIYATHSDCDPLTSIGLPQNKLSPTFMVEILGKHNGLIGLFLTGLTAALLSTVSSLLSGLSTVMLQDMSCSFIRDLSESKKIIYCQALVFFYGGLSLFGILIVQIYSNVFEAVMILDGIISTATFTLILLGTLLPQMNVTAATIAEFSGIAFGVWIGIGNRIYGKMSKTKLLNTDGCNNTDIWINSTLQYNPTSLSNVTYIKDGHQQADFWDLDIYNISFDWYSLMTLLFITILGYILTLCLGPETNSQYRDMVPPAVQKLHLSLPKSVRKVFLCDIYEDEDVGTNCELTALKT